MMEGSIDEPYRGAVPADMPFIWAAGANVRWHWSGLKQTMLDEYQLRATDDFTYREVWYKPRSEFDLWEAGWPFPVP